MVSRVALFFPISLSDPMQTNATQIPSADIQAVRDFLMGATDEVRISSPRPAKAYRPSQQSRPSVPVTQGISRARTRSTRPH